MDRAAGRARASRREPRPALLARRGGQARTASGEGAAGRAVARGALGARQRLDHAGRADGRGDARDGADGEALGSDEGARVAARDRGGPRGASSRRLRRAARAVRAHAADRTPARGSRLGVLRLPRLVTR